MRTVLCLARVADRFGFPGREHVFGVAVLPSVLLHGITPRGSPRAADASGVGRR